MNRFSRGLLFALWGLALPSASVAQSSAFSFQGYLVDQAGPASGGFDIRFQLFDAVGGGGQVGSDIVQALAVSDGVFSTTLDFGDVFDGAGRWVQVAVRPSGSSDPFEPLSPRTAITAVPYALGVRLPLTASVTSGPLAPALNLTQGGDGAAGRFENSGSGVGLHVLSATAHAIWAEGPVQIQRADLGLDGTQQNDNEALTVEASDALVGLYSDGGGSWGSGIELGQSFNGTLDDKWTMVRRTVGAGSDIYWRYGTESQFINNTTKMILRNEGTLYLTGNSALGAPNLRLVEEDATDFSRISLYNTSNGNFWDVAAGGTDNDWFNLYRQGSGDLLTVRGGSGNVGIHETNPQERLHVDGTARADKLVYNAPRTHYMSFPSEAFLPTRAIDDYVNDGAGFFYTYGTFATAVHLPHGAVVTKITVYYLDDSANSNITFSLLRRALSSRNSTTIMASLSSTETNWLSDYQSKETSSITAPTIDNAAYTYALHITSNDWDGTGTQVRGVSIEYTLTEAL